MVWVLLSRDPGNALLLLLEVSFVVRDGLIGEYRQLYTGGACGCVGCVFATRLGLAGCFLCVVLVYNLRLQRSSDAELACCDAYCLKHCLTILINMF